jgi:hypothetical protein
VSQSIASILILIICLLAPGCSRIEESNSVTSSRGVTSSARVQNFLIDARKGIQYTYYRDGSCKSTEKVECISKEAYFELCKRTKGITNFVGLAFGNYNSRFNTLYRGGDVEEIEYGIDGDSCKVTITAGGLIGGTSSRIAVTGRALQFVLNDNGVMIHYAEYLYEGS